MFLCSIAFDKEKIIAREEYKATSKNSRYLKKGNHKDRIDKATRLLVNVMGIKWRIEKIKLSVIDIGRILHIPFLNACLIKWIYLYLQ